MKEIFIYVTLIAFVFCSKYCENNGTYLQQEKVCLCPTNFIGKNCSVSTYPLKETFIKIPLSAGYTYTYFQPQQKVIYRFVLTFCAANSTQQTINLRIYAEEQQIDGDIYLQPITKSGNYQDFILLSNQCKKVESEVLISVNRKKNGQLPKIIFGFKLIGKSAELQDQYLEVQCQSASIFTVNLLFTVLISIFFIIIFFLLGSVIFMLRKKWLQRRLIRKQQQKKIKCVNSLMPLKKYETLVQQYPQNTKYDQICSICLCQFQKEQDIRETPCLHIFHANCLQSWCNSQLTCPICRKNFEQQQQLQDLQKDLKADNSNIRQAML